MTKTFRASLAAITVLGAALLMVAVGYATDEDGVPTPPGPGPSTVTSRDSGSVTTIFTGGNSFAGNTFDIQNIGTVDVTITGWEINIDPNTLDQIDIYWRTGTANGNQENPVGWTLLGSDPNVVSAGENVPTPVVMPAFTIAPGELFGFYLVNATYGTTVISLNYTDGGPTTFSSPELSLTTYHGVGSTLFGAPTFYPRQWNGTVYYSFVPVELQAFTVE